MLIIGILTQDHSLIYRPDLTPLPRVVMHPTHKAVKVMSTVKPPMSTLYHHLVLALPILPVPPIPPIPTMLLMLLSSPMLHSASLSPTAPVKEALAVPVILAILVNLGMVGMEQT
jgi:hypothetical protein